MEPRIFTTCMLGEPAASRWFTRTDTGFRPLPAVTSSRQSARRSMSSRGLAQNVISVLPCRGKDGMDSGERW